MDNEKFIQFWKSSDTNNKFNNLGEKCSSVISALRTNEENKVVIDKENPNKSIKQNQLVLDNLRFRWIDRKGQYGDRQGLSLGLHDITFNDLTKNGLHFSVQFKPKDPRDRRVKLYLLEKDCDNGCVSSRYSGRSRSFYAFPRRDDHFDRLSTTKPWLCTMDDIRWPSHRQLKPRPSVRDLALAYGIPVWAAHRALTDCIYLADVLARCDDLEQLLKHGMEPRVLMRAKVSYDNRSLAKDAGFHWNDPLPGCWSRRLSPREAAELPFEGTAVEDEP